MEVAGLAVNILSLYNAVFDILVRFDAYRNFATESRATIIRFEAAKIRLHDWADSVGIKDGKLISHHDPRLDDLDRASMIRDVLDCLKQLLDKIEYARSTIKLPTRQRISETNQWTTPLDDSSRDVESNQSLSKRSRIAWATGGKDKLNKDVVVFEGLVNALYHIASPKDPRADNTLTTNEDQGQLSDIEIALSNIRESLVTLDQRDVIDWLDAVEYQDEYDKHISLHLNGACEWILSHPVYQKWQASERTDGGAKVLWIHGPAGFGKTVLSAWLTWHIRQASKIPIAHYFSSSHAQRNPDLECIVRSWITQLAQCSIRVLGLCLTARRKQSSRRASRHEVWDILTEILAQIPSCILALDGLDELPNVNDARSLFLKSVKRAVAQTNVKMLITSRNTIDIASEISVSASQPPNLMLECKISNENVRHDVHQYSEAAVARKFPKQSESFRKYISARMAKNSGGMFLCVKLQQSQLRGSQSKKTVERIVEGMPQGLHQTYNRNWNSIQELPEPDRNRAIDILRWLTFGYNALTVEELAEALVIELDGASDAFCEDDLPVDIDEDYICNEIKGLCFSLVDIQEGRHNPSPIPAVSSVSVVLRPEKRKKRAVKCICGLQDDDGYTVMCAHCTTWQHTECYYFEDGQLSDVREIEHLCGDCKYQQLDVCGAAEHQRMLRKVRQAALRHREKEVMIAREPDTVRLVHISVRDYLVATLPVPAMVKAQPTQGSQSAAHHAVLAAYCLRFLDCPRTWAESDDDDSRSFLAYAVHSWFQHLHDAQTYYDSVSGLVHSFMKPGNLHFANWRTRYETDLCIRWGEPIRRTNPSAMYYACSFGLLYTMDFLRNNEAEDIDSVGGLFGTALQAACVRGYRGAFDRLMQWGADFTVEGGRYHSAINAAASGGHCYMVQTLVDREARINVPTLDNARVREATRTAARQGHAEIVRLLLGHDIATITEAESGWRWSAYLWGLSSEAAAAGHVGIVKLFLDHGADIEARDHNSNTLLHRATAKNDHELIADLIRRGASVAVREGQDYTPLHFSAVGGNVDVVACLLAHGADINAQSKSGRTPLHCAAGHGQSNVMTVLLDQGCHIDAQTNYGHTPLYLAISNREIDTADLLLRQGAGPNIATLGGDTALFPAVRIGNMDLVRSLISNGCNINAKRNLGDTALRVAIGWSSDKLVEYLIVRGADMFTIDEYQMTCSDWLRRLRPHLLRFPAIAQRLDKSEIGPNIAMLRRHISDLAGIIRNDYRKKDMELICFSKCLLMLGMENDARLAYQLGTLAFCDGCDHVQIRTVASYHCKSCPDTDLCGECMTKHKERPVLDFCREHAFMRIVASEARIRPDQTEALNEWLCGIEEQLRSLDGDKEGNVKIEIATREN
ncbi:MAG: hypothetical protein Q9207_004117 [Kuettlingeria erythrocarpa]